MPQGIRLYYMFRQMSPFHFFDVFVIDISNGAIRSMEKVRSGGQQVPHYAENIISLRLMR